MIKQLGKSMIQFEVTVPFEKWEQYLDQAAAEVSEEIKIAGFRPGKAPRKMVEQKVGAGVLLNSAAEKAVQKSYVDFVVENKLEVIGSPEVKIEEIKEGEDLVYVATVAVMPEVTVDAKYKEGIKAVNAEYAKKTNTVSDDEINLELDKLANSRAKLVTVNREARKDDNVEVDFAVLIDGAPIENGTSKNHPLVIGKELFIPGFEDKLIGMREGEEKEFELPFPADYHQKELAGKKATFQVKVNLVQERQIPAVDDEFAKSLGNFENLEAIRKNMREGMEHENEHKQKEQKRTDYVEKIVECVKAEIPEILFKEETNKMLSEFEYQIQSMGMTLDQYLEKLGKKREDLAKDWAPQAEKRVKSALALSKLVKDEEIVASTEEIEAEMNKTMQYYKNVKDMEKNIDMERLYNYTKGTLENEKLFQSFETL
jgi:trigger factor